MTDVNPSYGGTPQFGYPSAPAAGSGYGGDVRPSGSAPLAGWWARVGATLIDGLILGAIYGVLYAVTGQSAAGIIGVIVQAAYTTYLIGRPGGQTIGMMALGNKAVGADDGAPLGFGRGFVRWLVQGLLGFTVILGLLNVLWPLWDRRNQTIHDKAANSVVLRIR